ncbi:hypothetical protein PACTADRAFT_50637 [Pachysolen tannophilus NRRL Y-2460]|uniref:Zn(2)-C6 fungal-type domain-containing protein n=1 Tax=Pachysolen tannophilus NRRL Y-2460 TaxID=669874 RepID=A0A1E4TSR3_PACTA|nr:hypothetical protein PACTADRAFT_50637 [Pachysolen tannophilus NRRL Y-2460]
MSSNVKPESKQKRTRSRFGCQSCKKLKVKCDEERPSCGSCIKRGKECDYSIKLTWGGRPYKKPKLEKMCSDIPKNYTSNGFSVASITERSKNVNNDCLKKSKQIVKPEIGKVLNERNVVSSVTQSPKQIQAFDQQLPNTHDTANTISEVSVPSGINLENNSSHAKKLKRNKNGHHKRSDNLETEVSNYIAKTLTPGLQALTNALETVGGNNSLFHFENIGILNDLSSTLAGNFDLESITSGTSGSASSPENHFGNKKSKTGNDNVNIMKNESNNVFDSSQFHDIDIDMLKVLNTNTNNNNGSNGFVHQHKHVNNNNNNNNNHNSIHNEMMKPDLVFTNFLDELDSYAQDISKIEQVDPVAQSNFSNDIFLFNGGGNMFSNKRATKYSNIDEDEEEVNEDIREYSKEIEAARFTNYHGASYDENVNGVSASNEAHSFFNFNTIPRGLLPLPDLLLNIPYYAENFHFFRNVTSYILVPAPEHLYKVNPFKVILPRLAMTNDSILSILIAFGLTHKTLMLGQPEPKVVLDQLLSRALNELLILLQDDKTSRSDLTLALVLMIGSYEMFSGKHKSWKLHIKGAKQILLKRKATHLFRRNSIKSVSSSETNSLKNFAKSDSQNEFNDILPAKVFPPVSGSISSKRSSSGLVSNQSFQESDVSFFLARWFAYIDVLAALCSSLKPQVGSQQQKVHFWRNDQLNDINYGYSDTDESDEELDDDYAKTEKQVKVAVDMFLGFDLRYLPIFDSIITLIKEVNVFLVKNNNCDPSNLHLPISLITRAIETKERLTKIFESSERRKKKYSDEAFANDKVLSATNKNYFQAGLLHLYRRVFLIPRDSTIVQSLCKSIANTTRKYIENCSSAEICSLFCMFIASAESLDADVRNFFYDRFTKQSSIGNHMSIKARDVAVACWETGKDWMDIIDENNIDITFV